MVAGLYKSSADIRNVREMSKLELVFDRFLKSYCKLTFYEKIYPYLFLRLNMKFYSENLFDLRLQFDDDGWIG